MRFSFILAVFAPVLCLVIPLEGQVPKTKDIPKYTVREIREQGLDLDGELIKLEFRWRSAIRQMGNNLYSTYLYGPNSGSVYVEFGKEGLTWMRSIDDKRKTLYVFGRIRVVMLTSSNGTMKEGPKVELIGRTMVRSIDRTITFKW